MTRREFASLPLATPALGSGRLRAIAAESLPQERWVSVDAPVGAILEHRTYRDGQQRWIVFDSLEERGRNAEGKWDGATSLTIYEVIPAVGS